MPVRPGETRQVEARDAARHIRDALDMGGTCSVAVGARRRTLVHDPLVDRPGGRLPWPLGMFQKHTVRYVVYEDERRVSSHIFVRNRMDEAIEYFLRDVDPRSAVTINFR